MPESDTRTWDEQVGSGSEDGDCHDVDVSVKIFVSIECNMSDVDNSNR